MPKPSDGKSKANKVYAEKQGDSTEHETPAFNDNVTSSQINKRIGGEKNNAAAATTTETPGSLPSIDKLPPITQPIRHLKSGPKLGPISATASRTNVVSPEAEPKPALNNTNATGPVIKSDRTLVAQSQPLTPISPPETSPSLTPSSETAPLLSRNANSRSTPDSSDPVAAPKPSTINATSSGKDSSKDVAQWQKYIKGSSSKAIEMFISQSVGKNDLLQLPVSKVLDADIIKNLKDRFGKDLIYCRIGPRCLVSLNPFKEVLSNKEPFHTYDLEALAAKSSDELNPHPYELASSAYLHMRQLKVNQTIVAIGESGSGKTSTTLHALHHLLYHSSQSTGRGARHVSPLHPKIHHAQRIISALGCAKTTRNNNSSRFHQVIDLRFKQDGELATAYITDCGLEADRVLNVPAGERNFHIFYYMLAGLTTGEKQAFGLKDIMTYSLLNSSECTTIQGVNDAEEYQSLRTSLGILHFNPKLQESLFRAVAGILCLANLTFIKNDGHESAQVENEPDLVITSTLLGVSPLDLEAVLTSRIENVNGNMVATFHKPEDAFKVRDNLVTILYQLLFRYVIARINSKVAEEKDNMKDSHCITLLDFAGFDSTKWNSLNKLMTNYAHERLLHVVKQELLVSALKDHRQQGLVSDGDEYSVPEDVIAVYDHPERGVFTLLTKESNEYNKTFMALLKQQLEQEASKPDSVISVSQSANCFVIKHTSGSQMYSAERFYVANHSRMTPDFVRLFRGQGTYNGSSNEFCRSMFAEHYVSTVKHPTQKEIIVEAYITTSERLVHETKTLEGSAQLNLPEKKLLSSQFRQTMQDLMESLGNSTIWTMICIRPNAELQSNVFNSQVVANQVRWSRLSDLTNAMRRYHHTVHIPIEDFLEQFGPIVEDVSDLEQMANELSLAQRCERARVRYGWGRDDVLIGNTVVFLSERVWRYLIGRLGKDRVNTPRRAPRKSVLRLFAGQKSTDDGELGERDEDVELERGSKLNFAIFPGSKTSSMNEIQKMAAIHEKELELLIGPKAVYVEREPMSPLSIGGKPAGVFSTSATKDSPSSKQRQTLQRRIWLAIVNICTFWIPTFLLSRVGKMVIPDARLCWREKLTLCMIVLLTSASMVFVIEGLGWILCPFQNVALLSEIQGSDRFAAWNGYVYDLAGFNHPIVPKKDVNALVRAATGLDLSLLFPRRNPFTLRMQDACEELRADYGSPPITNSTLNVTTSLLSSCSISGTDPWCHDTTTIQKVMRENLLSIKKTSTVVWSNEYVRTRVGTPQVGGQVFARIGRNVYNITEIIFWNTEFGINPFPDEIVDLFEISPGQDFSSKSELLAPYIDCLDEQYFIGLLDTRNSPQCQANQIIIYVLSAIVSLIMVVRFLCAFGLRHTRHPAQIEKYVLCMVPCYTEGESELRKTIDSIALTKYSDPHKLICVVADGMIKGAGNDDPTPEICLDIFSVPRPRDRAMAYSYIAVAEGARQHNRAKVFSGYYTIAGRTIPYMVIAKVGAEGEIRRPGNRGKRDSQLILMKFLSHVYYNQAMTPLEIEIFRQMKETLGMDPKDFEFCLMVDADTELVQDSLIYLVSQMFNDTSIAGICGETKISNEKENWVTMLQVYEYFISHNLAKAFESTFGSVTCLPGCFSLYRVYSTVNKSGLIINPKVIDEYQLNMLDTLHKRNLLALGEDRFLTTLILKHFPRYKTVFTPDAVCLTVVPDSLRVLLSQRRRWINSTVHNLWELLLIPDMCGFFCFSMRFLVFLDLMSTLALPFLLIYLVYFAYKTVALPGNSVIPIIMISSVYLMQSMVFLVRSEFQHFLFMIISILGKPISDLFLPLYAFWHFDDFSWGNTRIVAGASGKESHLNGGNDSFDPSLIPLRTWDEFERERTKLLEGRQLQVEPLQPARRRPSSARNGALAPIKASAALIDRPSSNDESTGKSPTRSSFTKDPESGELQSRRASRSNTSLQRIVRDNNKELVFHSSHSINTANQRALQSYQSEPGNVLSPQVQSINARGGSEPKLDSQTPVRIRSVTSPPGFANQDVLKSQSHRFAPTGSSGSLRHNGSLAGPSETSEKRHLRTIEETKEWLSTSLNAKNILKELRNESAESKFGKSQKSIDSDNSDNDF